jgi:microcystin-dependent protein
MATPFIAEIRIFGFNFAPRGWAFCQGQIQSISQNTALFSLLGTNYGGDGRTTFGLPDLRGRSPLSQGQGPGLTPRIVGERAGTENVTLLAGNLPAHTHTLAAVDAPANQASPGGNSPAQDAGGNRLYNSAANVSMGATSVAPAGGGQPHSNLQPSLVVNFCIALQGAFPARN